MENPLFIIMRCPNCLKDFPPEVSFCETCSVILEPVETENAGTMEEKEDTKSEAINASGNGDKLEEATLETLKTDIENKFVFAILLEMEQLKKKLSKKENLLSELEGRQSEMDLSGFLVDHRKAESEIEGIIVRIAKLETAVDHLKDKIQGDIQKLEADLSELKDPGILWFLKAGGRYYRMLSSELKTKKSLMAVIQNKKSEAYLKTGYPGKIYLLFGLAFIIALAVSWSGFNYTQKGRINTAQNTSALISEKTVMQLLEDIKKANQSKDLVLLESKYSKNYPELSKRKSAASEQWQKYDFKSMKYTITNLQIRSDSANATVKWEMELNPRKPGTIRIISQQLYVGFILEDGMLRISSVTKAGQ
jgi:hypothetical protein